MGKRKWIILGIIGLVVCLLFGLIRDQHEQDTVEYCYQINEIVKDLDFYTAKVTENGIELYDRNFDELEIVSFDGYKRNIRIMAIHKDGGLIYFILIGNVDDESGIMFVNDGTDGMMNGIHSLDRIGGNSYYYDTSQSP